LNNPDVLYVRVDRKEQISYKIEYKKDIGLLYSARHPPESKMEDQIDIKIEVSDAAWKSFKIELEKARFWEWVTSWYSPSNVEDETEWYIKIKYGRKFHVFKGDGIVSDAKYLKILLSALSQLVEDRKIE